MWEWVFKITKLKVDILIKHKRSSIVKLLKWLLKFNSHKILNSYIKCKLLNSSFYYRPLKGTRAKLELDLK